MMTFLDCETTAIIRNNKRDPSPLNPGNRLVSVGWDQNDKQTYICFNHNHRAPDANGRSELQTALDNTTVLVAHHIKFDLAWLLECGFIYDKSIYCTMIAEYVIAGGLSMSLSLEDCCARHGIKDTKDERAKKLWQSGMGYEDMPWDIVQDYGLQDVALLKRLYYAQQEKLDRLVKEIQDEMDSR